MQNMLSQDPLDFWAARENTLRHRLKIILVTLLWSGANVGLLALCWSLNWLVTLALLLVLNVLCYIAYLVGHIVFARMAYNFHQKKLEQQQPRGIPYTQEPNDTEPIVITIPSSQDARTMSKV